MIDGVLITPQREIAAPGGNVFHVMKAGDAGFQGFGEAYFSTLEANSIKPWKRHNRMTLNVVVHIGKIRFVLMDGRPRSSTYQKFQVVTLGNPDNYARLTVPPGVWMAFQSRFGATSWLINVANLKHDPQEADRMPLGEFVFNWDLE
jgi:dTDP-4-dehydrorhamnose 3,5-epimerase